MRDNITEIARTIRTQRYPDAMVVFAAGSIVRGDGTAFSDLDLVVAYASLPNAYRESFCFDGLPVEAFVHDPETMNYFFLEFDRPSGIPALAHMVRDGIEIPESTEFSRSLKDMANGAIEMGPPTLTDEQDRQSRYGITDLLDDIRDPRSYAELVATGGQLHEALADYYFRANGRWSARGKSIPRVLETVDPVFAARYRDSFEVLYRRGDACAVIALAEEVLNAHGGLLFEGDHRPAPAEWRKPRGA